MSGVGGVFDSGSGGAFDRACGGGFARDVGTVFGIVLGGGSGARFGGPKQFLDLAGLTLLERSVRSTLSACDGVVCVVPDPADPRVPAPLRDDPAVVLVPGGSVRAASVRAGLAAVPEQAQVVVVADAAHPLASPALVGLVVEAVRAGADGAVPGLPLAEVPARVVDGVRTAQVLPREGHVLVQTPQAFRADLLRAVHADGADGVEDSAMVAALVVDGRPARVVVVPGDPANLHVTTPAELELARRWCAPQAW